MATRNKLMQSIYDALEKSGGGRIAGSGISLLGGFTNDIEIRVYDEEVVDEEEDEDENL